MAIQAAVDAPLIHIADATARAITESGSTRPLLLATRYTMEQDFHKGRLRDMHGIDVVVPNDAGQTIVHDIIYDELCQGIVSPASKASYLQVIEDSRPNGVDGVIYHEGRTSPEHSNVRYGLEVRLRRQTGLQAIVLEADTHDLRLFSIDRIERKLKDFIEMQQLAGNAGSGAPAGGTA